MDAMEPDGGAACPGMRHGASFGIGNKLFRVLWGASWLVLGRFTPPPLHSWRVLVLRAFGAKVGRGVRIYGSTRVWDPRRLAIGAGTLVGPRVNLYNQGRVTVGRNVVISQDATICASTHDVDDPTFPLLLRPVTIGDEAWIAALAFVGPGVRVGEGTVLGACAVAMRALEPWTYYTGNPAVALKPRGRMASAA
jgi:putative colanic acid biosynthesis acetyltransferase WcaF